MVNSTEFSELETLKSKPKPSSLYGIIDVGEVAYKQNIGFSVQS